MFELLKPMDKIEKEIAEALNIDPALLPVAGNEEEKLQAFRKLLITRIEELAARQMDKLMWLLYRVDVSEKKLHETLKHTPPENFAPVIADLIIERQIQKIKSRKEFDGRETDWNFDI